ncbi:polyamine-modulated factor 1-binding protein 1 [Ciconia boyciana]|uniref:polyamine-modulated factor 1-binding protein 1 n=1 Tax=Ciconia boyciana TaxID=52775 RepID=UPI003B9ED936
MHQHQEFPGAPGHQGQRQASVPEPRQAEPQACQDTQQQELEPAQVLASIQALQLDLDFCRGTNRERLVQLQQQECAVQQKHQDLVFLMQHYRAVMGKDQKDEAVQTEVTSYVATHSHSDTSYNILKERTELLEQVVVGAEMMHCRQKQAAEERRYRAQDTQLGRAAARSSAEEEALGWGGGGGGNASQPPLSQAAQAPAQQLPAPSILQRTEEQPCLCLGKGVQHEANCEVEAELQALQKEAASSKAEQAQSRELAARLQAELSQWQWKQQVTLEQALRHMHAAAHAEEKLQRSQEQLQALREQLGAQEEQSQGLWHSLARLQDELGATQAREQQRLQQLSGAKETIQGLQLEVASNRKHLAELLQQVRTGTGQPPDATSHHAALSARAAKCCRALSCSWAALVPGGGPSLPTAWPTALPAPQLHMQVQDMATLQAELAQAQQEKAKQEEKIAAYEEQRQQLHWELRKLQGSQEQSKQEASSRHTGQDAGGKHVPHGQNT